MKRIGLVILVVGLVVIMTLVAGAVPARGESTQVWHKECVDTPYWGWKCMRVFGPGPDLCSEDSECQPLPPNCDALCKSLGYDGGACRQGQVYRNSPSVCKAGEVPAGWAKDCYIPSGMVGAKCSCCCKPPQADHLVVRWDQPGWSQPGWFSGSRWIPLSDPTPLEWNEDKGYWTGLHITGEDQGGLYAALFFEDGQHAGYQEPDADWPLRPDELRLPLLPKLEL